MLLASHRGARNKHCLKDVFLLIFRFVLIFIVQKKCLALPVIVVNSCRYYTVCYIVLKTVQVVPRPFSRVPTGPACP